MSKSKEKTGEPPQSGVNLENELLKFQERMGVNMENRSGTTKHRYSSFTGTNLPTGFDYKDTIKFTSEWYYKYYRKNVNLYDLTLKQIRDYGKKAQERHLLWAR